MKLETLGLALILVSGMVLGQSADTQTVEADPGIVSPGNPLYGAEVAVEDSLVGTPLVDPGNIAYERASEMAVAQQKNNSAGFEKANKSLNKVAKVATNKSMEGLEKAEAVLGAVKANAPEQAQKGLSKALDNVKKAQEREFPDAKGRNNQRSRDKEKDRKPDNAGGSGGLPV